MSDKASPLQPVDPDDLRQALEFALTFDGRKKFRHAEGLAARLTADHLVRHLERCGFIVVRGPGRGDFARIGRGSGSGGRDG